MPLVPFASQKPWAGAICAKSATETHSPVVGERAIAAGIQTAGGSALGAGRTIFRLRADQPLCKRGKDVTTIMGPVTLEAMTDEEVLVLYGAGDPHAARELVGRLGPRALGFARRILGTHHGHEAEDLAQEALLRLWRAAPGWHSTGGAKVSTWLYAVIRNLAIDRMRQRQRQGGAPLGLEAAGDPVDPALPVEARLMQDERSQALQEALTRLPERQRIAVVMRHLEGCHNPEIAAVLGVGVEAVESLTARGKRALQAMMAEARGRLGLERD